MNQHRSTVRFVTGLALAAGLVLGTGGAAQARDTGWNGTKIVTTERDTGWNGTRDTGWNGTKSASTAGDTGWNGTALPQ